MKFFIFVFLIIMTPSIFSQEDIKFQKPSKPILDLVEFERAPSISIDHKKQNMLLSFRDTYKTLQDLNIQDMRLGGLRINPKTNISSTITYANNLKLRKIMDIDKEPIQVKGLPKNPQIAYISWSDDDSKIAFTNTTTNGVELWVINVSTAQATKLTDATLNANLGTPYSWHKDNNTLLVQFIPKNRPNLIDPLLNIPDGPIVTTTDGTVSQNRTYQDLLKNKTDEANFETLITSELYNVNLKGKKTLFKSKDMFIDQSISPDGNYIMITTIQKPFSYIVSLNRFPQTTTIYNKSGKLIKTIDQRPLIELMPKGFMSTQKGKRNINWVAYKPSSIYYIVALDEGDPAIKVNYRDEIFVWDAPFNKPATSIAKTIDRFNGIIWGNDQIALLTDKWFDTRSTRTTLINPSNPYSESKEIFKRNYQDIYSDPGSFETRLNQYGRRVLAIENNKVYLIGDGFKKSGQFPFIDEMDLTTFEKNRLYQSIYTDKKEDIYSIEDFKEGLALVRIQSQNEYPNYYFRKFKGNESLTQITYNKNPFESIKNVEKQVIKYKRNDGVELSGTLYLPIGYNKSKKEKLPLLIWAYPEEFKDKRSAGQSTHNVNDFTFPNYGSFVYWVTKGYIVLDDASFPIIGEGDKEPNDTFIEQLVADAKAAIDAVDQLGYIDRTKVACGGHSYGAFMVANLLTHSDLFKCGIARSGAYNRTLTPFGFQSEQRNFWDAPQVYDEMSPFYSADKMKKPILLIHGEADNNPGTFTLQTERYFQAIKGLGGNARMVILPKESHGYVAIENILHLLWEQEQFLDKYLKN